VSDPYITDGIASIVWIGILAFGVCFVMAMVVAGLIIRYAVNHGVKKLSDLFRRKKPPQVLTVLSNSASGQHQTCFVSRHHLASGGLTCPLCQMVIAAGDFTGVKDYVVDGRLNEGVVCQGEREIGDRMEPCRSILLASPDTEHGDHLGANGEVDPNGEDPPEYYRFVRVGALQALREKWGVEVKDGDMAAGTVDVPDDKPAEPQRSQTAVTDRLPTQEAKP
jgi:hypothetical protein